MRSGTLAAVAALLIISVVSCLCADTDGDGISDDNERLLGTFVEQAEEFVVINEDGVEVDQGEGYDASKDVVKVEFAHVAEDRYVWRTTFADPPVLEDAVHHIYVDADSNRETGRPNETGTDYMLSMSRGRPWSNHYRPDGTLDRPGPVVYIATEGNALLTCADVELGHDEQGVRFDMWVLSHTATREPPMSDSTGRFTVQGIPLNDREKIMRPGDLAENTNVAATFGLDIIRPILRDDSNVVVRYDELQLDGYEVDIQTSRRYGHLIARGNGSTASYTLEEPGTYYVGFLMYDDSHDERVVIRVNDEFEGLAAANVNNNRHWIYWLDAPHELQAGDTVSFEAVGPGGKHGIARILLMPTPPEVREVEYAVQNTHWIAPVGTRGEVSISWTTTWPSDTRFEYGQTTQYGQVVNRENHMLLHRAHLTDLDPGTTYHGRGLGITPEGETYFGPDITFTAEGIQPPPTIEGTHKLPLTVRNWHDVDAVGWPVSNGVPFPEGHLADVDDMRVMHEGREVMAQLKPLGTWPDGSIKWVLVTILADVPAGDRAKFVVEYGRDVDNMLMTARVRPIARDEGDHVTLNTGEMQFTIDRHGQIVTPNGPVVTELVEAQQGEFTSEAGDAEITIEEYGPIRAVVKTVTDLVSADGSDSFRIEQRIMAYQGQSFVKVQHTFINDNADSEFTDVDRMSYVVPAAAEAWQAQMAESDPVTLQVGQTLWQRRDREFIPPGADPAEGRITGALIAADGSTGISVRDFWQNYPKGFAVTDNAVRVDLAPDFEAGFYDEFPFEKEGHQLYYYLREGTYTFKRGMAKTHDMLLDFGDRVAANAKIFQRPLLLTAQPEWYTGSRAFYNVAPRNEKLFAAYEEAVDRNIQSYIAARERQHDFGMMNYGDWYGERGSNWGNIEYDTQHAFFLEYIRSGNPDAFFLGDATEVHNRDIDTVQWAADAREVGAVYVHQMCHVGGYYDKSVPNTLGFPRAGYTVSHAWTEGHFDHYFLSGDPRSLETGRAVADFFAHKMFSRPYDWSSCRTPGWHLIMNAAALAATNDPYYLNSSRIIVDRVLETQDVEPRELHDYQKTDDYTHQVGGWTRQMVPGHCHCEPRHRGNANFMVAILLSGLTYYHDVTHEPAVKEAIIRGAHFLVDDMYSTETHGFKYTSCPNMRHRTGVSPLYIEGIARAYRWTDDEKFLDPLTHGLALGAGGSSYGKGFSMYYRAAPRLLADLAAVGLTLQEREKPELVKFEKPQWMNETPDERMVVIQAEDFAEEAAGSASVMDDRHATWGTMITKWHADIGHWLRWSFEVPEDGRYRLIFRYATSSENTRRKVEIDGAVPHEVARAVAFPSTGGFGHHPDDWEYMPLADAEGNEIKLQLSAGEHTLTMTNLQDGLGLDFVVLVRYQ
ncbi:MAG: hypothetical protein ACLFWB_04275 [Armatimonadota bacterium]